MRSYKSGDTRVNDACQSARVRLRYVTERGVLIGSLIAADLIDEYLLMIHPLVLGTGRRLFPGGVHVSLRLSGSVASATGVVIATYEPTRD
jgi:dihydrofolate reductase